MDGRKVFALRRVSDHYRVDTIDLQTGSQRETATRETAALPDPTKKMTAEPQADLASLNMELKFKNGALASTAENADGSKVPAAIVKAVGQFLPLLAADAVETTPTATLPAPRLYKIIIQGGVVRFAGVEPTEQLEILTTKGEG